jgi:hypothetical protein
MFQNLTKQVGLQVTLVNQSVNLLTSINVTTVTIEQVTYSTYHIQSFSNRLLQYGLTVGFTV